MSQPGDTVELLLVVIVGCCCWLLLLVVVGIWHTKIVKIQKFLGKFCHDTGKIGTLIIDYVPPQGTPFFLLKF